MRQERTVQSTIFEVFARHEIGCELKTISQWLDRRRPLVGLVAGSRHCDCQATISSSIGVDLPIPEKPT